MRERDEMWEMRGREKEIDERERRPANGDVSLSFILGLKFWIFNFSSIKFDFKTSSIAAVSTYKII